MKGVKDINMVFNEMSQNSSLELKLQGQGVTPHRDAQEHRFYSFGDNMTLKRFRTYIIKIRENTFFEEDPSQTTPHLSFPGLGGLGGALGLWYSLGFIQILQEITLSVLPLAKKCQVCGNV